MTIRKTEPQSHLHSLSDNEQRVELSTYTIMSTSLLCERRVICIASSPISAKQEKNQASLWTLLDFNKVSCIFTTTFGSFDHMGDQTLPMCQGPCA